MSAGPTEGDSRREALLSALEASLRESELDDINIADISSQAGVTRSAFYFYFANKAAAAAALMDSTYEEIFAAAQEMTSGAGGSRKRFAHYFTQLFEVVGANVHIFKATLAARGTSRVVREMWERDIETFALLVAGMINEARRDGQAPDGPDAVMLARSLVHLNDRAIEGFVREDGFPLADRVEALSTIWQRSIYCTEGH